jgi:hypothetical protein
MLLGGSSSHRLMRSLLRMVMDIPINFKGANNIFVMLNM